MPIHVTSSRYGAPAYDALRRVVAGTKADDPLDAVTLVVPTNLCGVIARRALARGYCDDRPGVAGLTVATLPRVAELLAARTLTGQGRRPVSGSILAAAWRRALDDDAGPFAPVADHPATVRALVDAHRALRDVSHSAMEAVAAATLLGAHVVRLHRGVVAALRRRWYDTVDLLAIATALAPESYELLGTVVLFLPQELDQTSAALVRALGEHGVVRAIVGLTGEQRADAAVRRSLGRLGLEHDELAAPTQATATRVLHASDSDDEVRCVVRDVVGTLAGTPAHRVAVLYGSAVPYARLLHEHLTAAGVTVNGAGVRPTREHAIARGLLELLTLPDHGMRRDDVFRLLSEVPVYDGAGNRVPASRWERISRSAGVVKHPDWDTRLQRYAEEKRRAAERERASDDPDGAIIARHERDAEAAAALRAFTTDLAARLAEGAAATTWSGLAAWTQQLVRSLFGDEAALARLPEEEARAAGRIDRILVGLAGLDELEPAADLTAFRQVVELELAESLPRIGRYGEGVLVAPLSSAVGLDADVVYVVGLAEDLYPGRHNEESLLPDRVRVATAGELPASRERLDRRLRHLQAAFAAAPAVVASFPRGDLRRHSNRRPSRWLLPTLRALAGDAALAASEWKRLESEAWFVGSPSYAGTIVATARPASEQEWRLRTLTAGRPVGDRVLDRATMTMRARTSDAFTRYDGNLAGLDLPDITEDGRIVSPTLLEAWATCPHAYFVQRMLRVQPVEEPEKLVEISALDIGALMHETFDAFVKATRASLPGSGEPWSAEHRALLLRIAGERADAFEHRGVTGHPRLWQQERARILADLAWLLDADDEWRARKYARLVDSELKFGMDGEPPVVARLPDGREIRFRGSADRVDLTGDGTLVVTDVKTGSTRKFKGLGEADPVMGGTKLQLPVYAYAARARYGRADSHVETAYWFVRKDRGTRIELPLTTTVEQKYAETLAAIADGIAAGVFPQRPPEQPSWGYIECPYCDPDGLGHRDARRRWERKRAGAALSAYRRLAEPEDAT